MKKHLIGITKKTYFKGTISESVLYGNPNATESDLVATSKKPIFTSKL